MPPGYRDLAGVLGAAGLGFLFYHAKDLFAMLATAFNGAEGQDGGK